MCGGTLSVQDRSNGDIMSGGDPPDAEGLTGQPSSNGLRPPTHGLTEGRSLDSTKGHEFNFNVFQTIENALEDKKVQFTGISGGLGCIIACEPRICGEATHVGKLTVLLCSPAFIQRPANEVQGFWRPTWIIIEVGMFPSISSLVSTE